MYSEAVLFQKQFDIALVLDSHPSAFFSASEQKNGIIHITNCVCQEFDTVSNNIISSSDSVTSFQMMKLLFPHIETLLKVCATAKSYVGNILYLFTAVL